MRTEIILFVFPHPSVIDRLCNALLDAGFRSISAETPTEAQARLDGLPYLTPDLVITHPLFVEDMRQITDSLAKERMSYVLLTNEDMRSHFNVITGDDVVGHVAPPYEAEALLSCLSVAFFPAQRGTFPTISPFVLFQTLTAERKTGTAMFTRGAECITVRFRDGHVVGAKGLAGAPKDVLHYVQTWSDGAFRVALEPTYQEEKSGEQPGGLLLAGMQRI